MTVGIVFLIVVLICLIGNSLYVYLDSGVIFSFYESKSTRQVITSLINMILLAVSIVGFFYLLIKYWNVPL